MNVHVMKAKTLVHPVKKNARRVTLYDAARVAGVSIQTVSAVLLGKSGIPPQTQNRVRKAIEKTGYRPNPMAQSLRTGRTRTIALVVSDIANPSFATIASAVEECCHDKEYSMVLYNTHNDPARQSSYVQKATQGWIDGMLFVSVGDMPSDMAILENARMPVVVLDRVPLSCRYPSVALDNEEAGRLAATHLIDLGHRRVAHICGPKQLRLSRERCEGFRAILTQHGVRLPRACIVEGDWGCASGTMAMQKILALNPRPTAVFAANDRMAIGAMRAIGEAGLRVPDDVSIMGLDDIEIAASMNPSLTTIRQPFTQLATVGLQLLLDLVNGKKMAQSQIMMAPKLVTRESTGPAPAR